MNKKNLFLSVMNFTKKIAIWLLILSPFFGCESPKKESISLSELTISQIHEGYQSGKFNSQQLLQAYLDRIEEMDKDINSISMVNPNAMEMAKSIG
jgi:amidase